MKNEKCQKLNEFELITLNNHSGINIIRATMQSSGNFVLVGITSSIWSSNTSGNPGAFLIVTDNGELQIKTVSDSTIWSTKTQSNCTGTLFKQILIIN